MQEFMSEKIIKIENGNIKKTELIEEFNRWHTANCGGKRPKGREVTDAMESRFGPYLRGGWRGIRITYDDDDDE
jgi:hypothetical protein